ncbi:hypothetical protein QE611_04005 [Streptococcus suis]|uniref:hypothetical protein n=1 Tax=Streptococcus suis TaxID=1307 RepID=UPI003707EBEA
MAKLIEIDSKEEQIEINKTISRLLTESRNLAKPKNCLICGTEQTSFCNSHSIPQFSLKNIAVEGKVCTPSAVMGVDLFNTQQGVKNTGIFHLICNSCDSTFFKNYENEENLQEYPSDKMLAEIAVKNYLLQLNKRFEEKQLYKIVQKKHGLFVNPQDVFETKNLDIRDYKEQLEFHKNIALNGETGGYQIIYWEKLAYNVPIAFQGLVTLAKDMKGYPVNNPFDFSEKTRMQDLHIAIFPLHHGTIVLAYYHKRDRLYRSLKSQFNSTSKDKKLEFINYLIFAYTENYYISPTIKNIIEESDSLEKLSQELFDSPNLGNLNLSNNFGEDYSPVTPSEIPNLLKLNLANLNFAPPFS